MKYIKVEIDLDKCSLSTIFEILLYSKNNTKMKCKKELITAWVLLKVKSDE